MNTRLDALRGQVETLRARIEDPWRASRWSPRNLWLSDESLALYEVSIREIAANVSWYCTLARCGAASIISVTTVTIPSFASSTVCGPPALGVKSGSCQT